MDNDKKVMSLIRSYLIKELVKQPKKFIKLDSKLRLAKKQNTDESK